MSKKMSPFLILMGTLILQATKEIVLVVSPF